ncbi:MAG: homocysteine S-methyltransferase [Bacteroidota bacterium]
MISSLAPLLQRQKCLVLDGGLATELEKRGAQLNDHLWSARLLIEEPTWIQAVHYDYLLAGADIITTASYQASFEGLARVGLSLDRATALFQKSVQLAQEARTDFEALSLPNRLRPLIAASIGPYGAYLADGSEYRGNYGLSMEELKAFHRARLHLLANSEVDLLAIETIPSALEAQALLELLEEQRTAYAFLSFSCRDAQSISDGHAFSEMVRRFSGHPQLLAIGLNCTAPQHILPLLQGAAPFSRIPLLVYPNSGEGWDAERKCWLAGREEGQWELGPQAWYRAGARIMGGCCRVGPEKIRQIRKEMHSEWSWASL